MADNRSIVIVDFAHSGTTMLAGILERLGVPMVSGNDYLDHKWEDMDIISALQKGDDEFSIEVEKRNLLHPIWGFKFPGAFKFSDRMSRILPNPTYLAIYKDPVSVSYRRFGFISTDRIKDTMDRMQESILGIKESGLNVHFFAYQQACIDPDRFVLRVEDICKTPSQYFQHRDAVDFITPGVFESRGKYPSVERKDS